MEIRSIDQNHIGQRAPSLVVSDVNLTEAELSIAIENFACKQGTIAKDNADRCNGDDEDVTKSWAGLLFIIGNNPRSFQSVGEGIDQFWFKVVTNHEDEFDVCTESFHLRDAINYCRREYARLLKHESIVNPGEHGQFFITICPAGLDYTEDKNCVLYRPPA